MIKIIIGLLGIVVLCITGIIAPFIYYALKGKFVTIQGKDYQLKGRLYGTLNGQNPSDAILFLSGWNPGKLSWTTSDFYAGYCAKKNNAICLTVAFRGMGSDGDITTLSRSDFLDDAIAAYDFLTNMNGIDKERISIVGESFGSYIACILSSNRIVKNLALRVPTDFPNGGFFDTPHIKFVGQLTREWKLKKHAFSESFALNAIHQFSGNIFLIASDDDEFIPIETIENYLTAAPLKNKVEYKIMKNTDHGLINPLHIWKYNKMLSGWFIRYL